MRNLIIQLMVETWTMKPYQSINVREYYFKPYYSSMVDSLIVKPNKSMNGQDFERET